LASDPDIEVIATAIEGQMALDMLGRKSVDILILDIEMPGMDGITALPLLIKASPKTRIIMSSTLTIRNAEISLKALSLGASDYLAKPTAKDPGDVEEFYRQMISKIHALAPASSTNNAAPVVAKPAVSAMPSAIALPTVAVRQNAVPMPAAALAIASSTGGPQALLEIFKLFKTVHLRTPIFITQHMPPNFTTILAQHIANACGRDCHEAVDGEEVKNGVIYLAPGDFHMTAAREGTSVKLHIDKNPQENFCRPSADPMLRSLAKIYGGKLLVAVLTGLGSDGARGAVDVVAAGGTIIAQDEATSVVYGMPKAVADAKLTSAIFPLPQIAPYLISAVS
jgi:two-component system, chemotaxis family, protein-glutamate methylesterase/glutaminase